MIYFRHCCPSHHRKLHFLSPNIALLIDSEHLLKPAPSNKVPAYPSSHTHQFHTHKRQLPVLCSQPNCESQNHRYLLKNNGSHYSSHADVPNGCDSEKKSKSFSLSIDKDGGYALWKCFQAKCGFKGSTKVFADSKSSDGTSNQHTQVKPIREIKDDGGSEPSEQP